MKRSSKPLPGHLALFRPDDLQPPRYHDPTGCSWQECAAWVLENGTGVLSRSDNAFLLACVRHRGSLPQMDKARLSELHRRVGGRELLSWLPWESSPQPRRVWR